MLCGEGKRTEPVEDEPIFQQGCNCEESLQECEGGRLPRRASSCCSQDRTRDRAGPVGRCWRLAQLWAQTATPSSWALRSDLTPLLHPSAEEMEAPSRGTGPLKSRRVRAASGQRFPRGLRRQDLRRKREIPGFMSPASAAGGSIQGALLRGLGAGKSAWVCGW